MTDHVTIVEVGPRDGLQNESRLIAPQTKAELINRLARAGLRSIEAGSFVSPRWVPQMADSDKVFELIERYDGVTYGALTPNERGMESALQAGADQVAIFTAASETFNQRNINCSIAESIERFRPVAELARSRNIPLRGYVSCVLGCPYEGAIEPQAVASVTEALFRLGCQQVSLGDTIGVGTTRQTRKLLAFMLPEFDTNSLAVHFHDTYGQALANIAEAIELGIRTVDSSISGLGGCPYAKGASGNVATEDVVYMLHGNGIETGTDLGKLTHISSWISAQLDRQPGSKVTLAMTSRHEDEA